MKQIIDGVGKNDKYICMYRYFDSLHGHVSSFFLYSHTFFLSCSFGSLSLFFLGFFFRVSFFSIVVLVASFRRHDHDVNRWDKHDENERRDHIHQTSPNLLRSSTVNFNN
jgi:hypothetical protein